MLFMGCFTVNLALKNSITTAKSFVKYAKKLELVTLKPEIDTRVISRLKCAKCHVFVKKNAEKCPNCDEIFTDKDFNNSPIFFA